MGAAAAYDEKFHTFLLQDSASFIFTLLLWMLLLINIIAAIYEADETIPCKHLFIKFINIVTIPLDNLI